MESTLTAPGLYLRGIEPASAPPLQSGVTGFVGISERGPLNSPQPVVGWSEYVDTFGGQVDFGYLAESVFGFFRNGGEKCWVVRVADTDRIGAAPLPGRCRRVEALATAGTTLLDHRGDPTIRLDALDPGGWGNRLEVRIGPAQGPPIAIGVLTQPTTDTGTELFVDSVVDLEPEGTLLLADPDAVADPRTLEIDSGTAALDPSTGRVRLTDGVGRVYPVGTVVLASGFRLEATFRGRREVFEPLSMRRGHDRYFAPLVNGTEPVLEYAKRRRRGISILLRAEHLLGSGDVSRFRPTDVPAPGGPPLTLQGGGDGFIHPAGTFLDPGDNPVLTVVATADRGSAANGLRVVALPFGTRTALPVPDAAGTRDRVVVDRAVGFENGETVELETPDTGSGSVTETATVSSVNVDERVIELTTDLTNDFPVGSTVGVPDRFSLEIVRPGDREPIEVIHNLSGDPADGARFIRTALDAGSNRLCADQPPALFATPIHPGEDRSTVTLEEGADPGRMDARYYTGYELDGSHFHPPELAPGSVVGLATLERIDEVSLVAAPDLVRVAVSGIVDAQRAVLRHCSASGDRFALLDSPPPAELTPESWVASLPASELRRYGAAFHPWVRATFEEVERVAPPSGLIAGLFARTDLTRGIAKAPANETLEEAFGLEPPVDRARHAELNPLGINCVVKLDDGQIRLMGSRTLAADARDRHINVRRTILAVKKELTRRMLWAVFEPNGPGLRRRIEATLTSFLQTMVARGVTAGERPAEAFYVKCDEETNPPGLPHGTVVAELGIALLAPAEFIVLTARRTPDTVQVLEEEV